LTILVDSDFSPPRAGVIERVFSSLVFSSPSRPPPFSIATLGPEAAAPYGSGYPLLIPTPGIRQPTPRRLRRADSSENVHGRFFSTPRPLGSLAVFHSTLPDPLSNPPAKNHLVTRLPVKGGPPRILFPLDRVQDLAVAAH